MLNNIYNTISKTLSRGLIVVGLAAIVLSSVIVGGGVKVEAAGTPGWKITSRETKNGSAPYCGNDKSGDSTDASIKLDGAITPDANDKKVAQCVFATRGNSGKNEPETFGMFENCDIIVNGGSTDLFCKKATRLISDPRDLRPIPLKKDLIDLIDAASPMTPSHIQYSRTDCPENANKNGKFDCKIAGQDSTKPLQCYSDKDNPTIICDNSNLDVTVDGKKTTVLVDKSVTPNVSCQVELIKATDANATGYVPSKIIACRDGVASSTDTITNDANGVANVKRCLISRTSSTGVGLSGDLFCGDPKNVINFSGGKSQGYVHNNANSVEMFKTPDDKILTLNRSGVIRDCKNEQAYVSSAKTQADGSSRIVESGVIDCKVTQDEFFKTAADEAKKGVAGVSLGETGTNAVASNASANGSNQAGVPGGNAFGDFFTFIYKIIAAIIFALLFIVRYLQMFVLLMAISVMTVLLNLSPNTSFLTSLAVPLWGIFAQIANLGAVAILIYLGSATMIGIMKYQDAISKGTQVALYTFVSSFTYFGLAFIISLLDGFTKLIVFVFGGGSVFKLFEALIGSVSSISSIDNRGDSALIPNFGQLASGIGNIFGQANAGDVTTKLVSEIIVVIGLTLILIVFKNIFFMLLTRVAILLLLLITSPLWVLAYLVRESLPSEMKGMAEKALTLTLNSIAFNFVFVLTLVLVTIITQRINAGTSEFINGLGKTAFLDNASGGFALLDPVSASAQALDDKSFDGFGAAFTKTISVCVILSMNLIIIQKAFEFVETLIDQNIVAVGKAVGGAVSRNLQNFRKADSFKQGLGMMGKDLYSGATKAITGDNQLIADGFGAGLKGVSMTERGVRTTVRGIKDGSMQKGVARRTTGVLDALNIPKNGFNVVGNLKKNWGNTVAGGDAKRLADRLHTELKPDLQNIQNLQNQKAEVDSNLKDSLDTAELNLSTPLKADLERVKKEAEEAAKKVTELRENLAKRREEAAAELAKQGLDINDSNNPALTSNPLFNNFSTFETSANARINSAEIDSTSKKDIADNFVERNANPAIQARISSLKTQSSTLDTTINIRSQRIQAKVIQRDSARRQEGTQKLNILKQQAQNLKNKNDYNSSKFGGFLNNYETLSKGIDKMANLDNLQEIENLRKSISELQRDGKLTPEQAKQIEANLTKDKTDQEKAVAEILEAIKANKTP